MGEIINVTQEMESMGIQLGRIDRCARQLNEMKYRIDLPKRNMLLIVFSALASVYLLFTYLFGNIIGVDKGYAVFGVGVVILLAFVIGVYLKFSGDLLCVFSGIMIALVILVGFFSSSFADVFSFYGFQEYTYYPLIFIAINWVFVLMAQKGLKNAIKKIEETK